MALVLLTGMARAAKYGDALPGEKYWWQVGTRPVAGQLNATFMACCCCLTEGVERSLATCPPSKWWTPTDSATLGPSDGVCLGGKVASLLIRKRQPPDAHSGRDVDGVDSELPDALRASNYVRMVLKAHKASGSGIGSCATSDIRGETLPCSHGTHMLPKLMERYRPQTIAEVGVCTGLTSIAATIAAKRIGYNLREYFMVDPWRAPTCSPGCGCFKQLLKVAALVPIMTMLRGYSVPSARMIANGSLDLAFIDAGHDFQNVHAVSILSTDPNRRMRNRQLVSQVQ